jgi:hypothetical protein
VAPPTPMARPCADHLPFVQPGEGAAARVLGVEALQDDALGEAEGERSIVGPGARLELPGAAPAHAAHRIGLAGLPRLELHGQAQGVADGEP